MIQPGTGDVANRRTYSDVVDRSNILFRRHLVSLFIAPHAFSYTLKCRLRIRREQKREKMVHKPSVWRCERTLISWKGRMLDNNRKCTYKYLDYYRIVLSRVDDMQDNKLTFKLRRKLSIYKLFYKMMKDTFSWYFQSLSFSAVFLVYTIRVTSFYATGMASKVHTIRCDPFVEI